MQMKNRKQQLSGYPHRLDVEGLEKDISHKTVRKLKKEKSRTGFYTKVQQDITIELRVNGEEFPYHISVNEEQLENICGVLTRRGVRIINN